MGFVFENFQADDGAFFNGLKSTNVPLIMFTVNDKNDMEKYIRAGATAIYRCDKTRAIVHKLSKEKEQCFEE